MLYNVVQMIDFLLNKLLSIFSKIFFTKNVLATCAREPKFPGSSPAARYVSSLQQSPG